MISGTTWNNQNYTGNYNTGPTINAPAFSTDLDVANFSTSELATIQEVWAQVAEDFAPFQVDVTTEDPGTALMNAGGQAMRALISTDVDASSGQSWYSNAGGVAYLNSWNWTNGSPVWIFANRLGNGFAKYVSEAVSHEVGHSFNLSHDGRSSPSESYYAGHGSGSTGWAPIMGVGYYRSLVQWSKGEYVGANNTQDDLAIISSALGYIADDHGNSSAAATQLVVGSNGALASTGLISTRTDKDAFKFVTQTGNISINVAPFDFATGKANLDVELTLLDAQGRTVAVVNSLSALDAALITTVPKGVYTLVVDGAGKSAVTGDEGYSDYDSLGKYSLSGMVVPNRSPVAVSDLAVTGAGNSIVLDVLLNDTDADQDTMNIVSVGTPSVGSVSIEFGKIRFNPPPAFLGQATFQYTIADELGATATGSVAIEVRTNVPPTIEANQNAVVGNEGTIITNTGTWSDSDLPANTVTLFASIGAITKNADGTWAWQIAATDQIAPTNVFLSANDGLGGITSTSFTYSATNLPPSLTRSLASVNGNVLTSITNNGTFSDVPADTVILSASSGNVTMNASGTWDWSIIPSAAIDNQTVTLTAQDEDGGSTSVTFVLSARTAVSNRQIYYKDSSFAANGTDIQAALDPSKVIAKSGAIPQTLSYANLINTTRGINGLVIDVAGLVSPSLISSDFVLRMSPMGFFDEATNPPSSWPSAPAPTGIFVTPGTATSAARVRLEWADNAIENRWLQIQLLANANTGLPKTEVYYLGHLQGEINGQTLGGAYFVNNADLSAALPVGQIATVGNTRDVDKNGFVLNADFIVVRSGIINGLLLRNITIPMAGSADEGSGTGNRPRIPTGLSSPISSSESASAPKQSLLGAETKPIRLAVDIRQFFPAQTQNIGPTVREISSHPPRAKILSSRREFLGTDALFSELGTGNFEEKLGGLESSL